MAPFTLRPLGAPLIVALGWVALLWAALFVAACTGQGPAPDVYAPYRLAMKPDYQGQLDSLGPLPSYAINVTLDPVQNVLSGTQTVHVYNSSPDMWNYLVFRLYPMLEQYGADMSIGSVAVDRRPAAYTFLAQGSAMRIDLVEPLRPGDSTSVYFSWTIKIPIWPDSSTVYALFGRSQEIYSLPLFYPSLAVYEAGPTMGTGRWWLEEGTSRGDAAFNYASLFVVTGTLPSDQIPVTSGVVATRTQIGGGQTRYVWTTGPVREFLIHTSSQFQQSSVTALGTVVTSYWLPQDELAGKAALQYAVAALRIYSEHFGPYPYATMSVAEAPLSFRGMEYPLVSLLGAEVYGKTRNEMEILTVHEIAHQWWYQLVHNDPVNSPWLDEALAEYSVKFYYEAMQGQDAADYLESMRWDLPVRGLKIQEMDVPLDKSVMSFASSSQYEIVIYGKGALFFDTLRTALGNRKFDALMQEYVAQNRYGIVTPKTLLTLLDETANPQLSTLYAEWVVAAQDPSTP